MNITLSTRNPSKAEQIKAIFTGLPVTILTLVEAGIDGEAVEDGITLEENALKKALYAYENAQEKTWAMADDTGLFITALNGEPGIKAARWAGDTASTEDIIEYTLKALEGAQDRSAYFQTVAALIAPDGTHQFFTGRADGQLLEHSRVEPQPKMPYSGLFMPDGFDQVWAEMTVVEENKISHRGKAFRQVRKFFEK